MQWSQKQKIFSKFRFNFEIFQKKDESTGLNIFEFTDSETSG